MTTYNKATLKTYFQTNDVPTGTDYANFIDSYVNIVETAEQAMAGPLSTTELITPRVSAATSNFSSVSAAGINTAALTTQSAILQGTLTITASPLITGGVTLTSALSTTADITITGNHTLDATNSRIIASAATFTGDVSAGGNVYCSGMRQGVGIVSAAGTTQGAAAILTNTINRGKGIADGSTTGFAPPANRPGLVQYLYNEGASANLWPPTGGFINGQAVNTPFALAASAMVTIVHLTASAYAVK